MYQLKLIANAALARVMGNKKKAAVFAFCFFVLLFVGIGNADHIGYDQGHPVSTPFGERDYLHGLILIRTDIDGDGLADTFSFCLPASDIGQKTSCLEAGEAKFKPCVFALKEDGFYLCGEAGKNYIPGAKGA